MVGAVRAALSVSKGCRSIPRARDRRAVDLLRARRLGGVAGARTRRGLGDAATPARRHLCHPLKNSVRAARQVTRRRGGRFHHHPPCGGSVPCGVGSSVSRQGRRGGSDRLFGRDGALAHLCFACAGMLSTRVPGESKRVAALIQLFAACLVEKYTDAATKNPGFRGGWPIWQLRKVEDYVASISLGTFPSRRWPIWWNSAPSTFPVCSSRQQGCLRCSSLPESGSPAHSD